MRGAEPGCPDKAIGRYMEKKMSANPIVHWELMGADGDAQKTFYEANFDWKLEPQEGLDGYHMVSADDVGVGGAVGQGNEQMPNYMTIYIQVESIDESLGQIEASGGTTVVPRTVMPGTVTFGLFNDPAGNLVGLVEAATPPA